MTCDRNFHQRMLSKKFLNNSWESKLKYEPFSGSNGIHKYRSSVRRLGALYRVINFGFPAKGFPRKQFAFFHFYLVSWYITIQREQMVHHFLHLQHIFDFFNDSFTHFFHFRKYLMNFLNIQKNRIVQTGNMLLFVALLTHYNSKGLC